MCLLIRRSPKPSVVELRRERSRKLPLSITISVNINPALQHEAETRVALESLVPFFEARARSQHFAVFITEGIIVDKPLTTKQLHSSQEFWLLKTRQISIAGVTLSSSLLTIQNLIFPQLTYLRLSRINLLHFVRMPDLTHLHLVGGISLFRWKGQIPDDRATRISRLVKTVVTTNHPRQRLGSNATMQLGSRDIEAVYYPVYSLSSYHWTRIAAASRSLIPGALPNDTVRRFPDLHCIMPHRSR